MVSHPFIILMYLSDISLQGQFQSSAPNLFTYKWTSSNSATVSQEKGIYPCSLAVLLFYRKKNKKTRKNEKYLQAWNESPEWMSKNSQQP